MNDASSLDLTRRKCKYHTIGENEKRRTTGELSISGSEVARRLNLDRFAISQAVQREENVEELDYSRGRDSRAA